MVKGKSLGISNLPNFIQFITPNHAIPPFGYHALFLEETITVISWFIITTVIPAGRASGSH